MLTGKVKFMCSCTCEEFGIMFLFIFLFLGSTGIFVLGLIVTICCEDNDVRFVCLAGVNDKVFGKLKCVPSQGNFCWFEVKLLIALCILINRHAAVHNPAYQERWEWQQRLTAPNAALINQRANLVRCLC
jgi:hypothetical protein